MNKTKISRRSFLAAAGAAGASIALTACGGSASGTASSAAGSAAASSEAAGESVELIVFAAASLTETLNAIAETYSADHPGVTFRFNFDSSGTLKTQIQEGADCDLFISAGQKQMNQLDSTASADVNTEGLDLVDSDTRVDLLENKVVLCVPEGSNKGIDSFDALAEHLKAEDILFCMGNSDVPVGQYTQKILAYYDLDEAVLAAADHPGPVYLRFGREAVPVITDRTTPFAIGKARPVREGQDCAVFACGALVYEALLAAEELAAQGISLQVTDLHTIKPLDAEAVTEAARRCGAVVTAEEHQVAGGLFGAVSELLARTCPVPMEAVAVQDTFGESGPPAALMARYGLDAAAIVRAVLACLARKG